MNRLKYKYILLGLAISGGAVAASIDDVKLLIDSGKLDEASAILTDVKDPSRYLWQGRIAFLNYDFDEARSLYGKYLKALGKGTPASEAKMFERQLQLAEQALESVAQIEVIDSITVPKTTFLSAYRLPASAGRIADPDQIPVRGREDIASSVFFNERDDFALWAEPDTTGVYLITEATRLIDGSWSEPRSDSDILNNGGDTDYPFMCADGITLYYAADGDDSLGGLDIFLASRDPQDGTYLKPRNIGMPFNSPFDDYMMAIDEENGIGWWATDRNRLGDKITVYVYKLADSRTNIDPDDENLISLARLSDISMTQDEDRDYTTLKRTISGIQGHRPPKPVDFHFYMPGRGVLTSYADLRTSEGRRDMKIYQDALIEAEENSARLRDLRRKYGEAIGTGGRNALKNEIIELEKKELITRDNLKNIKNKIIRSERRN